MYEIVLNFGLWLYLKSSEIPELQHTAYQSFDSVMSPMKVIRLCSKARTLRVGAGEKEEEEKGPHGAQSQVITDAK